jgi:hypothetical protein
MPARITHDVVATIGEYTDRESGLKKKRYHTCGKCFTDDEGRQSIKLDAIPGPGWSGWLSLYPVEKQAPRQAPDPRPKPAAVPDLTDADDDVPF